MLTVALRKKTTSNYGDVPLAILLSIAALNARGITGRSINDSAKKGQLNEGTNCYSSNQKAVVLGTARSAVCLSHLNQRNVP